MEGSNQSNGTLSPFPSEQGSEGDGNQGFGVWMNGWMNCIGINGLDGRDLSGRTSE